MLYTNSKDFIGHELRNVKRIIYSLPVKHPLLPRAFACKTRLTDFNEQGLKLRLFILSPDVALANMM